MKAWTILLLLALIPLPASAAETAAAREERGFSAGYREAEPRAETAEGIRRYAEDARDGAQKNFGRQPVHDNELFAVLMAERLEHRTTEGEESLLWDVEGWVGSDEHKLYLESEGVRLLEDDRFEEVEVELLYARTIAAFWDLKAGVRHDLEPDPERSFAVLGVRVWPPTGSSWRRPST
jgi:copper resistance protein B